MERSGAAYNMVTAELKLTGEDGSEIGSQTVLFEPYETESRIEMSFYGNGKATANLSDFKGCKAGSITSAEISYLTGGDSVSLMSATKATAVLMSTSDDGGKSFELANIEGTNGFPLRVDYVDGQLDENKNPYGYIYDEGLTPEVAVGVYYFPSTFEYGTYSGYSSPSWRNSYYVDEPTEANPDGHGFLNWYDWRTSKKGCSFLTLRGIPMNRYMSVGAECEETRSVFGGQQSVIEVFPEYVDSFGYLHGVKTGTTNITVSKGSKALTFSVKVGDPVIIYDETGSTNVSHGVTVTQPTGGNISVSPAGAAAGENVTITLKPDEGKTLASLSVTGSDGSSIAVTKNADGSYSFVMPYTAVTITATFKDAGAEVTPVSYEDVKSTDWFYDAVRFCGEKGIMTGTAEGIFSPAQILTRAETWKIDSNMEEKGLLGKAVQSGESVKLMAWYDEAMKWAMSAEITDGTNPTANVTREQYATILYRYAQYKSVASKAE